VLVVQRRRSKRNRKTRIVAVLGVAGSASVFRHDEEKEERNVEIGRREEDPVDEGSSCNKRLRIKRKREGKAWVNRPGSAWSGLEDGGPEVQVCNRPKR
jgi:hypothetical protein